MVLPPAVRAILRMTKQSHKAVSLTPGGWGGGVLRISSDGDDGRSLGLKISIPEYPPPPPNPLWDHTQPTQSIFRLIFPVLSLLLP